MKLTVDKLNANSRNILSQVKRCKCYNTRNPDGSAVFPHLEADYMESDSDQSDSDSSDADSDSSEE